MQGIHDLGGREGFGVLEVEKDEPAFHHRWEAAVFAMMFAAGRAGATGNSDRFRHAIERIDPAAYLEDSYYGRWLGGLETLFVEAGFVTREAIDDQAQRRGAPSDAKLYASAALPAKCGYCARQAACGPEGDQ